MSLLFRVLNDYDIACNPLYNGLASKKLIYDMTFNYLIENETKFIYSLNEKEKVEYCKKNMMKYINTHQHKLKRMIDKQGSKITKKISLIDYGDIEGWANLLLYLSTLTTHLSNGSRSITDWISATKKLSSISKYYKKQKIHKVSVLGTTSNGMRDDSTLVIDLSSRDMIEDILGIINKKISDEKIKDIVRKVEKEYTSLADLMKNDIFDMTSENFVGFKYANYDNEMCIYRFYPSEKVISVLEQLQIDLIEFGMFNFDYLKLSKDKQILELNKLKEILKYRVIRKNDSYMLYTFEQLYLENKNVDFILENDYDKEKLNHNRIKILTLARDIHNIQIR